MKTIKIKLFYQILSIAACSLAVLGMRQTARLNAQSIYSSTKYGFLRFYVDSSNVVNGPVGSSDSFGVDEDGRVIMFDASVPIFEFGVSQEPFEIFAGFPLVEKFSVYVRQASSTPVDVNAKIGPGLRRKLLDQHNYRHVASALSDSDLESLFPESEIVIKQPILINRILFASAFLLLISLIPQLFLLYKSILVIVNRTRRINLRQCITCGYSIDFCADRCPECGRRMQT
jgi:hypothetical protein